MEKEKMYGVPPNTLKEITWELPDVKTTFSTDDYLAIIKEALIKGMVKNKGYKKANIERHGEKGLIVRIGDCFDRLETALWDEENLIEEDKLTDIIHDMINFLVYLELYRKGKW